MMIQDVRQPGACRGPMRSRVNWANYPDLYLPRRLGSDGRVFWDVPDEVVKALQYVESIGACNPGITIALPANSLVDSSGQPPQGMVLASVYTVDVYEPGAMLGDGSARANEALGYMLPFGAGGVTFSSSDGKYTYQLKKNAQATLTVPIHKQQLGHLPPPPPQIPLLLYDEETGMWDQVAVAQLNGSHDAYVGQVTHLSAYNMDLVKTDQACVRINSQAIDRDYLLEVIIPTADGTFYRSVRVDNTDQKLHAIYNLPSRTNITLQAYEVTVGLDIPITGPIVVYTGEPQNPSIPNEPAWPYGACNSEVTLTESTEPPAPRQLKITNLVGDQKLDQVVQVKIIPWSGVYSTDDLLTPDTYACWNLPGESIDVGTSRTFDIAPANDYHFFIGMGKWETDLVTGTCPDDYPWVKTRFFLSYPDLTMYYVWIKVDVRGHTGGVLECTITGSYVDGNLYLSPTGNSSIPFQITESDPL